MFCQSGNGTNKFMKARLMSHRQSFTAIEENAHCGKRDFKRLLVPFRGSKFGHGHNYTTGNTQKKRTTYPCESYGTPTHNTQAACGALSPSFPR